jgi:NH3-dependent NAD+ synthetase
MPVQNVDGLIDERVDAILDYHRDINIFQAELDLSGGIDSAVMAGLLVQALGPHSVTLVYSSINSGSESQTRAVVLAEAMGARLVIHDLTATYETMVKDMRQNLITAGFDDAEISQRIAKDNTILGSIRSCLRAPLGRGYLRMTGNGIRHGTGNECEDRWLRFYQKGGDGEVDSNPVAMLSKGEIFQLARGLGERLQAQDAYRSTITAAPTPELWGTSVHHTDEDEIGTYLGMVGCGESFYSYIDPQTGRYRQVGLIERVARFNDTAEGAGLFDDNATDDALSRMLTAAESAAAFVDVSTDITRKVLLAARRTERSTRHKFNPNCPSMGTRQSLVEANILTNTLPKL